MQILSKNYEDAYNCAIELDNAINDLYTEEYSKNREKNDI